MTFQNSTFLSLGLAAWSAGLLSAQAPLLAEDCNQNVPEAGIVSAVVRDADTRAAIPVASVQIDGPSGCLQWADSLGRFEVRLEAGVHTLWLPGRAGFETADVTVSVAPGDTTRLHLDVVRGSSFDGMPPAMWDGVPPATWPDGFYEGEAAVIALTDLQSLRRTEVGENEREVRFWSHLYLAEPRHVVVMREAGGQVHGRVLRYWPSAMAVGEEWEQEADSSFSTFCTAINRGEAWTVCEPEFEARPEWEDIFWEATQAGVWTLPDPSRLPPPDFITLDGWGMTVEVRAGQAYRAYRYETPEAHEWPEARQAEQIAEAFGKVWSRVKY